MPKTNLIKISLEKIMVVAIRTKYSSEEVSELICHISVYISRTFLKKH